MELDRQFTIVRGNSSTGKSTFINMVKENVLSAERGMPSVSKLETNFKSIHIMESLEQLNFLINSYKGSLILIDEENDNVISSTSFANLVKHSDNYYVIVTRRDLPTIPYSVKSIYFMESKRKIDWRRNFTETTIANKFVETVDKCKSLDVLISEDRGSGFTFYSNNLRCRVESSDGSSNVLSKLIELVKDYNNIGIVVDSAAFGPYIEHLVDYFNCKDNLEKNLYLFLPESFEYLILQSNLFKNKNNIKALLKDPSLYCETTNYFSYERLFTKVVSDEFSKIKLKYDKGKQNISLQDSLSHHKRSIISGLNGFPEENIKG